MQYIDSGTRHSDHAVASWLRAELNDSVAELRVQSGFFSKDALTPFSDKIEALADRNGLIRIVVGSNDGATLAAHVATLIQALKLPRERSDLGIVCLSGAYFHPKTMHLRRANGTETAYVGSANFTRSGIAAKHVEAGLLLDSAKGDPPELLAEIGAAIDAWFAGDRPGIERVLGPADVQRLLDEGVISAAPLPRPPRAAGSGGVIPKRPTLLYLVNLTRAPTQAAADTAGAEDASDDAVGLAVTQYTPPYPPYMYFAPDTDQPTVGAAALTGAGLGGPVGLIVKLSRDNDRHWREAPGTANLSVPISTASSIRFGFYGERRRPRAEFEFRLRYLDDEHEFLAPTVDTALMSYGFTPGDTGHADLRLVIPKPPVAAVRAKLVAGGLRLPEAGDIAVLEWPTQTDAAYRLTVTDPNSGLGQALSAAWAAAAVQGQLASRGACWLEAGLTPAW